MKKNFLDYGVAALAAIENHGVVGSVDALKELFVIAVDAIAAYDDASAAEQAISEALEPASKPTVANIAEKASRLAQTPRTAYYTPTKTGRETSWVSTKEAELIKSLVRKGMGDADVARETGRPTSMVGKIRREAGLRPRNGAPASKRERRHYGEPTAESVQLLLELYISDVSLSKAAETAAVSQTVARTLLDEVGVLRNRVEAARARARREAYRNGTLPQPDKAVVARKAAKLVEALRQRSA